MEEAVGELQTRLTAVQAALEGNLQSGLFQLRSFNGLPNEDINEWLSRFETLAKFHTWSNAKKLSALPLSLGGPAKAWYDYQPEETTGDFKLLTEGLKTRFGSQTLEFLFRQELYARKQGPTEPLSMYTEDIIKKSQRLALSDKDLMNVFINGLCDEIKNHVILNQPKSFAEAENLARLREAVFKNSGVSNSLTVAQSVLQEQRIKELESHVNLLVSLAAQKKSDMSPHSNFGNQNVNSGISSRNQSAQAVSQQQPVNISVLDAPVNSGNMKALKDEIVAAINTGFQNNQPRRGRGQFRPSLGNRGGARGRNLRTTDGQPICNFCQKVGHVAKYCSERPQQPGSSVAQPQQTFYAAAQPPQAVYTAPNQPKVAYAPAQRPTQGSQNLNGMGPSTWGY